MAKYAIYKHYVLRNFDFKLSADIRIIDKKASLMIWTKTNKIIFSHEFPSLEDALEIIYGFGHGFEYLGTHWEEVI